ncbi:exodeoxyribonuclease VII large subunit [Salinicoccus carnicancri]|uniref:exodeoxyribonuclease VII large subunit n=1 Tax=Salinicoccus carnicancri TaxID=558170 RepID=UPI00037E4D29|nr:exodeoxyribonuclease VII large subunit [Salinicoccus carnicancri]
MENNEYLSVGALTKYLKYKFDQDPYLTRVFIKGELSNVKKHTSGHIFFALKDGNAVIRAIMFSRSADGLKFDPENGQSVLIQGRISIYESSGQYQIYVDEMEIDGIGLLFEQLEKDKKELAEKGYFDAVHKKTLPRYPERITIISSETSAAYRDMLTTLRRRYPLVKVSLINTLMQGRGSRQAVIESLENADGLGGDIVILARGGGSIEDLWTFNEKSVAVKVFEMRTPVITGVGHETDTTLVDFLADARAATPTAAAELAVPDRQDIEGSLEKSVTFMMRSIKNRIGTQKNRLEGLSNYYKLKNPGLLYDQQTEKLATLRTNLDTKTGLILRDKRYRQTGMSERVGYRNPGPGIARYKEILYETGMKIDGKMADKIAGKERRLGGTIELLNSLSPTNTLLRGYSFTTKDGDIVRDARALAPGDEIDTRLAKGKVRSKVTEVKKDDRE